MLKRVMTGACLSLVLATAALASTITIAHVETDPGARALWDRIGQDYTALHPDVTVTFQYIENEAYKAKLPTMLQSRDRPSLIYSWAGGVMRAQAQANYLRAIPAADRGWMSTLIPAATQAYDVHGTIYGAPVLMSEVAFFYNKTLFAKAGVKAEDIRSWDDFLGAVKTLKAAGITPILVGAGEKWPLHFYWSYLALRIGGPDLLKQAEAGQNGGFSAQPFVDAGRRLQDLVKLDPFQPGYQGTLALQAAGLFGDGRGAMQLMGNWLTSTQKSNAADGKGLAADEVGIFAFPVVAGGKGAVGDTLGGVNGFLVTRDAPKETEDFLRFFSQAKYQQEAARIGGYIPAVAGTADAIVDPATKAVAADLAASRHIQIFFDQDLGPSVGRVVNDVSVSIAAGRMTPEEGAKAVQQAWDEQ